MIPALDQRSYLATLRLPEGVALQLLENARYSPARRHIWSGSEQGIVCVVCGLTWQEVTRAPEVVVCLGERVREKAS